MDKVVVFLRGVNMAGHNKIKMADLQRLFVKLGYKDATTYIQSGNVVFTAGTGESPEALEDKISNAIKMEFSLDIVSMVRTASEMEAIIKSNPYIPGQNADPSKVATLILKHRPGNEQVARMDDVNYPPDKFFISGKEIFIYCPDGFGKTKLYTNFFENRMKVSGTARNWNSITILAQMAKKE